MNKELMEALDLLEKEKGISKDALFDAIDASLKKACENNFGSADNVTVNIDRETCDFVIYQTKTAVEEVSDSVHEILLEKAKEIEPGAVIGSEVHVSVNSKEFGRIAAQNAKSIILQKIREEERQTVSEYFNSRAHEIMTGIVQRVSNGIVSVNLGKADAILTQDDIIPGETFQPTQRIHVYVVGMRDGSGGKGPRVQISRTKAAMVRKLFEMEVAEIKEGIVEIRGISREAGSRTKMAVWSNDEAVDPIGACIGVNGSRINPIVDELHGEKIDIVHWDENPAVLVENALSPAKVVAVAVDEDEKAALVVVPDNQLSLAIGMKGQNARLAAKLTGFKIDIKSESQARDEGLFDQYDEEYDEDDSYDEDESYDEDYEEADGEEYEADDFEEDSASPEEE